MVIIIIIIIVMMIRSSQCVYVTISILVPVASLTMNTVGIASEIIYRCGLESDILSKGSIARFQLKANLIKWPSYCLKKVKIFVVGVGTLKEPELHIQFLDCSVHYLHFIHEILDYERVRKYYIEI
jgi:hypothetical protein